MSRFVQIRSLFSRERPASLIHLEEWPEQSGKARVLIENPERADLWAHADLLRKEGYDVAMCGGPDAELEHTVCPLLAEGQCPLVDGADVVVSTTQLTDSREILATLSARTSPALVVEGTSFDLERDRDVTGDAVQLKLPVLPRQLVDAVERARSARASD